MEFLPHVRFLLSLSFSFYLSLSLSLSISFIHTLTFVKLAHLQMTLFEKGVVRTMLTLLKKSNDEEILLGLSMCIHNLSQYGISLLLRIAEVFIPYR